ncbi:MAG: hypothetical protein MUC71_11245 [Steroidobacteraceae bacterium]|jgi:hypothetical protein|nr:hypothetical protein [Steroidobacteraceae bacterium]
MRLVRLLVPALALSSALAGAQTLDVPPGDTTSRAATPARGSSMATVESRFGTPSSKHSAVGQPPITRWDYPQFSVFFEHDKVIHAVLVPQAG